MYEISLAPANIELQGAIKSMSSCKLCIRLDFFLFFLTFVVEVSWYSNNFFVATLLCLVVSGPAVLPSVLHLLLLWVLKHFVFLCLVLSPSYTTTTTTTTTATTTSNSNNKNDNNSIF